MDAAGCLVIPAEILAEAGWPADAEFEVRVREGKIEIEAAVPVGAAAGVGDANGAKACHSSAAG